MKLLRLAAHEWRIEASLYSLCLDHKLGLARLDVAGSCQSHFFFLGGACNTVDRRDETEKFIRMTVRRTGDKITVTVIQKSSLWKSRHTVYVARDRSLEIFHRIEGRGNLDKVFYQRGFFCGEERGLSATADEIYSTAPNFFDKSYFHPTENFAISAGDNPGAAAGAQAFASPCYCAGVHERSESFYLSVGLAAKPGDYTWDALEWNPAVSLPATPAPCDHVLAGGWAAVYDGKQAVNGRWESPRLVLTFAKSREEVLPQFLRHCRSSGYLRPPVRRRTPAWWHEPIYCTWHDQCGEAADRVGTDLVKVNTKAWEFCTEDFCDRWLGILERRHCRPGIVILDATWAKNLNSGEPEPSKWRDMRAWIERCHTRNIRVFVWALAWSVEGLPPEECITRGGQPVACDITHPHYLRRFREMVRRWFSDAPDCLNADGVKLDGQLSLPTGPDLRGHFGVWGLELQRLYLKTLYNEAKSHKADACISVFSLHPYLADFTDMIRMGDMYTHQPSPLGTMRRRAELAKICQPQAVIDTDGLMRFNLSDSFVRDLACQSEAGTPDILNAEWGFRAHFYQPSRLQKLEKSDYAEIRRVFDKWRNRMKSA